MPRGRRREFPETLEERKARMQAYYQANREQSLLRSKAYAAANPEKVKASKDRWNVNNKDQRYAYLKEYAIRNKDLVTKFQRNYRLAHPQRVKEWVRRAYQKRAKDPKKVLASRTRSLLRYALLRASEVKKGRTFETLGYSLDDLRGHLEANFLQGMTWENMGEWHIDHVVPLACWNYDGSEHPEFKAAWALSNLRPLWSRENQKKNKRAPELSDFPVVL